MVIVGRNRITRSSPLLRRGAGGEAQISVIKIPPDTCRDSDADPIVYILPVLKCGRRLEPEKAQDPFDTITEFGVILRHGRGEVVDEEVFCNAREAYHRKTGDQELTEVVMNIRSKIPVARTVTVVIEQPEASHGIGRNKRSTVPQEMLVVHEEKLVGIQELAGFEGHIEFATDPDSYSVLYPKFDLIEFYFAPQNGVNALSIVERKER